MRDDRCNDRSGFLFGEDDDEIRCTLTHGHDGEHQDRTREHTTGEIVCWAQHGPIVPRRVEP